MRTVVAVEEGVVEVNWMWLPSFIGMNSAVKLELEKELASNIEGCPLTDLVLDRAHDLVVAFLQQKFSSLQGLDDFLNSLKYVHYE